MATQKITPFLWFDNQAEEAAQFYTSIFKSSNMVERGFCKNCGTPLSYAFEGTGRISSTVRRAGKVAVPRSNRSN